MELFFYGHALVFLLLLPACLCADSIGNYCGKSFKGVQTQANINHVLADLVTKGSVGGFATSSYGAGSSAVYGLAQCRGDVSDTDCSACLTDAAKNLPSSCPNQADARIWYDYCFMRYDTENFVGSSDTGYALILINVQNATNPEAFDKKMGALMSKVRAQAVVPGSAGLGRGKVTFTPDITIYGLAQCTRDISPLLCAQCLSLAQEQFANYCRFRKGCQVHYSSCTLRYEIYPFFFPLYSAATKTTQPPGAYTELILRH